MAAKIGVGTGAALQQEVAGEFANDESGRLRLAPSLGRPAADAILDILEAEGVEVIFGVPGGPLTGLFEAMERRRTIRLVLAKHEGGAAFMAASHARVRRSLAVCCGTSGPGATNALTGIASAQADSLPVLLLTGQVSADVFGKGAIQESSAFGIDLVQLFRPVTKASAMFPNADRIPDVLRGAIRTAMTGRRGAVHLSMPADLFRRLVPFQRLAPERYRSSNAGFDRSGLLEVARLIASARRACVLAGHGVALSGATEALRQVSKAWGMPVATSPKGKGVFPETDPHSLGVLGFGGHELAERYIAEIECDLLLVVGSSMNEFVTNAWTLPLDRLVIAQIDIDPNVIGRNYPVEAAVVGDARAALAELAELSTQDQLPRSRHLAAVQELRLSTPRHLAAGALDSDSTPLKPQRLVKELRALMPDDALLFVDNGNSILWGTHYFEIRQPNTYFIDLGLASMGSAVAGAVGGALAAPGKRVVALVGDAAFAMNGMEVHTAVEERLPVIWIVLNNGGHGMVHQGDTLMKGRDLGVSLYRVPLDAAAVARAIGARGVRVECAAELKAELTRALKSDEPTVIDAIVDPEEVPTSLIKRVETLSRFLGPAGARTDAPLYTEPPTTSR
jgi:acetolactate synthase I/II/III large subunit